MIRYQLPTGKTVLLTTEQWMDLSDEKIQELIASDAGIQIDDPFIGFDGHEPKEETIEIPEIDDYIEQLPREEISKIKQEFRNGINEKKKG